MPPPNEKTAFSNDLTSMAWHFLDRAYATFKRTQLVGDGDDQVYWQDRCLDLAEFLSTLTGIPVKTIKRTAAARHEMLVSHA